MKLKKTMIAEDIFKKNGKHGGALLTITAIAKYCRVSRDKARQIMAGFPDLGARSGHRYFYKDVAAAIARYCGVSREKARQMMVGYPELNERSGRRYFYEDVAAAIAGREPDHKAA